MKISKWILAILLVLGSSSLTYAGSCSFELDTSSIQINWTAFKTTQKVPVQGSFTEVTLMGETKVKGTLSDFLQQIEAEIPLKAKTSIRTGNPARDETLFVHFFKRLKNYQKIHGSIAQFQGNDNEGTFNLNLKMNGRELGVPMRFTREKSGHFEAKGGIDILDFNGKGPLEALHHSCEALHTGPDGISKTWPIVEIKLIANIKQSCDS